MANDKHNLEIIISYCDNIVDAVSRYGGDEEDFIENIHYSQSCAFSLFQIGEAVKRLSPEIINSNPNIEWKQIAKFRDIIAHQYGNIDLGMVWGSVINDVPELRLECIRIVESLS